MLRRQTAAMPWSGHTTCYPGRAEWPWRALPRGTGPPWGRPRSPQLQVGDVARPAGLLGKETHSSPQASLLCSALRPAGRSRRGGAGPWPGRPVPRPTPTDGRRGTGQWSTQTCPPCPCLDDVVGRGREPLGIGLTASPPGPTVWPEPFSSAAAAQAPRTCTLRRVLSPAVVKGVKR